MVDQEQLKKFIEEHETKLSSLPITIPVDFELSDDDCKKLKEEWAVEDKLDIKRDGKNIIITQGQCDTELPPFDIEIWTQLLQSKRKNIDSVILPKFYKELHDSISSKQWPKDIPHEFTELTCPLAQEYVRSEIRAFLSKSGYPVSYITVTEYSVHISLDSKVVREIIEYSKESKPPIDSAVRKDEPSVLIKKVLDKDKETATKDSGATQFGSVDVKENVPKTEDTALSPVNQELELRVKQEEAAVRQYLKEHAMDDDPFDTKRRIVLLDADLSVKAMLLKKHDQLRDLPYTEQCKLRAWLNDVLSIPFNKTLPHPVSLQDGPQSIKHYLSTVREKLDNAISGHDHVKEEVVDYIARIISNPKGKGNILALCGSKGCGKTRLIKRGVADALGRPFHIINLGGLREVSVLTGHGFTYVNSQYGRLAHILIQSGCVNPVIYLDEIDKIEGGSAKSMEVSRVLTHILDEEQNMEFFDEYFGGVKIDLSKVLFIASLNNLENVDPILRDRLKVIHMNKLDLSKKVEIGFRHILPELLDQVGLPRDLLSVPEDVMTYTITDKVVREDGCRQLKKKWETIVQKLNTMYITQTSHFANPSSKVTLTKNMIDELLKHDKDTSDDGLQYLYS